MGRLGIVEGVNVGRFNKPPAGVIAQSRSALERPFHLAYEEGEAYAGEELQSAGEEVPDVPIIARNRRYGGEGLTASLGESEANKHVTYLRRQAMEREDPPVQRGMFDQTKDGPWRIAFRALAFSLRKEYLQDAQRFPGAHTYYEVNVGQNGGTPGNRMLPPHRSRLTIRPEPRSFGSTTEKIA